MVYELCLNKEEFNESRDGKCKGPVTGAVGCDDGGGGVMGRERGMEAVEEWWEERRMEEVGVRGGRVVGRGRGVEAVIVKVGVWWGGQEQCDQSEDREKECAKGRGPGRRSEPSEQREASFFPLKC